MNNIRPVSDLRDNLASISDYVHENSQPVFLTKDGYADMVVLSADTYQQMQYDHYVWFSLREAEKQARETNLRFSLNEVADEMEAIITEAGKDV